MKKTAILLHDIRSIHNVGSIFRTADAFGVEKIYLSGYSPLPVDRFGRKRADLAKVALGAEESVPWEQAESPVELVTKLKKESYEIVVLEQAKKSVDYTKVRDFLKGEKVVVIFGNEVGGVPKELLDLADVIAEIPMRGEKESLNVSVAGGILLSRLVD
ncbi:MAG: TrmH family RNA methyltransferase [bacterium]